MSLWDLVQHMQISSIESNAKTERRRTRRRAMQSDRRIEELEDEVAKLQLLCHALVRVACDAGHLTPERLQAVIHEIDAEDGVVDGRVTPPEARDEPKPTAPPKRRKRHL